MRRAIEVCRKGIANGMAPFGSAIAEPDGTLVACEHNIVRELDDCTCHAEITTIRAACRQRGHDLSGLVIASTCEPCPMCAAAIHWAKLETVYFGASIEDAAKAGFSELSIPCRTIYETGGSHVHVFDRILQTECIRLFDEWKNGPRPEPY